MKKFVTDIWVSLSILFSLQCFSAYGLHAQSVSDQRTNDSHAISRIQKLREGRGIKHRESFKAGSDSLLSMEKYFLGLSCLLDSRLRKAGRYFKDALDSDFAIKNNVFREKCLSKLAIVFESQHHIEEAKEACFSCISMAEARGDSASMMYYLLDLYKTESKEGYCERVTNGLISLYSYFKRNSSWLAAVECQLELSACCIKKGDKAGFGFHIHEAEQTCRQLGSSRVSAFVNLVKAEGLLSFGDNNAALSLVHESLEICRKYNHPELFTAFSMLESEYLIKTGASSSTIKVLLKETLDRAQNLGLNHLCAAVKSRQLELASVSSANYSLITPSNMLSDLNYLDAEVISLELQHYVNAEDPPKYSAFGWPAALNMVTVSCIILFFSVSVSVLSIFFGYHIEIPIAMHGVSTGPAVPDNDEGERLINLYNAILERMETEKPYLDMYFSISSLGVMMNRSERYLSLAINKAGKTNFNRLVIGFRVKEACHLIRKYERSITMNEVAEMSGFANRMSFSRRFKEITGMSPTEYLDNIHA